MKVIYAGEGDISLSLSRYFAMATLLATTLPIAAKSSYHVTGSIPIPGEGGWDYSAADSANRRLYVSHGNAVEVVGLTAER